MFDPPDAEPRRDLSVDPQDALFHPAHQVYFRAGLLACREYMARFVEAESPTIANSIRANWWPCLGKDYGPPRQLAWAEVTDGEYGTAAFRAKDATEISPTQEALPVALAFLNGYIPSPPVPASPAGGPLMPSAAICARQQLDRLLDEPKDSATIHYDEDTIPHGACDDPLHCDCMCPECWRLKADIIRAALAVASPSAPADFDAVLNGEARRNEAMTDFAREAASAPSANAQSQTWGSRQGFAGLVLDERAEALWEELGGDLCICQRPDVAIWCEKCQQRINLIYEAMKRAAAIPSLEELTQAAEHAVSFLRACDWNNHTSETDASDIAQRLEDAMRASPSPSAPAWQPIETAPKDRGFLLAFNADRNVYGLVCWWPGGGWNGEGCWGWDQESIAWSRQRGNQPTHWAALPPPPASPSQA